MTSPPSDRRVLIPVLRSRAGRRLGRRLAVVEYVGRRSGRRHRLVTQYLTDGRTVRIKVGMAEQETWWRNVQAELEPQAVGGKVSVIGTGSRTSVVTVNRMGGR